jgi:hypothetical protein
VIDRSIVNIKHLSVAKGNSHEFFSIMLNGITIGRVFKILGLLVPFTIFGVDRLSWVNNIGDLFFLDLSESVKLIESRLSDRNNLLNNIPENTFGARVGGKRSLVCPSSVELE